MEVKIVNHVRIDGQEYLFDTIPEEKKQDISDRDHTNAVVTVGFREKKK